MASYTDTRPPSFTPYIAQQDVDLMGKVGMAKQAQYQQGYEKIQQSIDRVSGLDIYRDVDKNYLRSVLGEVKNKMTAVAAGDFSNYQLANSVSSMVSSVANDKLIQNAVISTAHAKKEKAFMEEEIKKGKSSPSNIYDFELKMQEWNNDPKEGVLFDYKYSPYVDVTKKWLEVVKSLHSDLVEQDIPYVYVDGKVDMNQTAAAMTRMSKEVVSKEKIETAIRATLSPSELNQLAIDGKYTFKDASNSQLLSAAVQEYTSAISENDRVIKEALGASELKTSRPAERAQLLSIVKEREEANAMLKEKLNTDSLAITELLIKDPDSVKAMLYKNGAIAQFASPFAWEHNKKNLLTNPIQQQDNWEREFSMAQSELNRLLSNDAWNRQMDMADLTLKDKEYQLKVKKAQEESNGIMGGFNVFGGANTDIGTPLAKAAQDLDAMKTLGTNKYYELMGLTGATYQQVRNAVNAYQSGDVIKIQEANSHIDPRYRYIVDELVTLRKDQIVAANGLKTAETIAEQDPAVIAAKNTFRNEANKIGSFNIGNTVFSGEEVVTFMNKANFLMGNYPTGFDVGGETEIDTKNLTKKELILADAAKNFNWTDAQWNQLKKYSTVATKRDNYVQLKNNAKYTAFNALNQRWQPRASTISFSSDGGDIARRKWEGVATSLLLKFDKGFSGQKGGTELLSEKDREDVKLALTSEDRQKITYKSLLNGNEKALILSINGKDYTLPMEDEEAAQLPIDFDTKWQRVYDVQKMQGGTTNKTGLFQDSWYDKKSFPRTSFNIKGDLSKGESMSQYATIRVGAKAGVAIIPLDTRFQSAEQAEQFFSSLTNEEIIKTVISAPDYMISKEIKAEFLKYKTN